MKIKLIIRSKSLILFCLFLTGCMVGPNYKKPDFQTPEKFTESRPSANVSLAEWWKRFNDPCLNELIQKAIANNYDLKISLEKLTESRDFYKIEKAKLFPEIDASAEALRANISKNLFTNPIFKKLINFFHVGFDAIWEIDIFGKQRRLKESAFYETSVKEEEVHDVYISVLSEVARYYIDIRSFNELCNLTREKIALEKKYFSLVQSRETTGLDSAIPVESEIATLQSLENDLLSLETSLKNRIYQLAILLGKEPESFAKDFSLQSPMPVFDETIPTILPSTLLRTRPDIRRAERSLAAATAQVGAAIADFFPSFTLNSTRAALDSSIWHKLFEADSTTWILGSLMKWPIITFGRVRAQVDAKKSEQKQALLYYEKTVLAALGDVEGAFVSYYNQESILMKTKAALSAIDRKTALYKKQYDSGLIGEMTYITEEKNLIDFKIREMSERRLFYSDAIALYKALGGNEW